MDEKTSKRQTTEQRRAKQAWADIESIDKEDKEYKEKYATLARKLASMIQINGLGTTMAFLSSKAGGKGNDPHSKIQGHLSTWVTNKLKYNRELMDLIRNEDMNTYRRATAEAIEYAVWLSRYVRAKDW